MFTARIHFCYDRSVWIIFVCLPKINNQFTKTLFLNKNQQTVFDKGNSYTKTIHK